MSDQKAYFVQGSGLPPPTPLNINASDLFAEYKTWMNSFAFYELAIGLHAAEDATRRATLLHCLGTPVQRIFANLPGSKGTYSETKAVLDAYFTPRRNVVLERHKFRQRAQGPEESVDCFVTELRELAKSCDFGTLESEMIRDQLVEKCRYKGLQDKLLQQEGLTLERSLLVAQLYEAAQTESKLLDYSRNEAEGSQVNYVKRDRNENKEPGKKENRPDYYKGSGKEGAKCRYCGLTNHDYSSCKAKDLTCLFCNKLGHLARVCKKKLEYRQKEPKEKLKAVRTVKSKVEDLSDSDEYVYSVNSEEKEIIIINGKKIKMVVDTGCERNLIGHELFKTLSKSYQFQLVPTSKRFYAYAQTKPLKCLGKFKAKIEWKKKIGEDVYVIEGDVEPLLGKKTALALNIVQMGGEVQFVSVPQNKLKSLIKEYDILFKGLGKIAGYCHKITIDKNIQPVTQRLRRVPYAMVEAVNQELDKMLEDGVIEEVHEGTEWVSNLLQVPKKDTNEIRLCVDLRQLNKAVVRERHPVPTVDNILQALQGSKVFAKLDARKGFWQVELSPESRNYTAFITHRGCYRFTKVPFGLSSAPEAYQKAMDSMLFGLSGVISYMDDVIVYANDENELATRLKKVFERFGERGLRLNRNKCRFGVNSVDVLGHVVTSEGIKPDPKKIEAILKAPRPENIMNLRSFLGTCGFLMKFIPDYANISEPLRLLTRKGVAWNWNSKVEAAFENLKKAITKEPCLAYYSLQAPTIVITDASPVGVGALVLQVQEDGSKRPIAFGSRSLTNTERRYSQIEKEALACVWAVERFNVYLWGRKFVLQTDHKPLIHLLGLETNAVLPPRIQRLSWRLQPYDFKIEYIEGKKNAADSLSRLPLPVTESSELPDEYIHAILSMGVKELKALTIDELIAAAKQDEVLQHLYSAVLEDKWPNPLPEYLKPFSNFKLELSIYKGLILKGNRIILPEGKIKKVMKLAHETHQGIVRTKQILRDKFYWPNMDSHIERMVKDCTTCVLNRPLLEDQPLQPVELPPSPWTKIGIDLVGPISDKYILTVIDYYTSYPEAVVLKDISAKSIIKELREIFARFGYPKDIVSDNGKQFVGHLTESYLRECGIGHIKASPYYPKSNGKIERFHRYLKKAFKSANSEGKDWRTELSSILMAYRSTPHRASGETPAFLMFSRNLRTKLPSLEIKQEVSDNTVRQRYLKYQAKMKNYADETRGAKIHGFQVGDVVFVANLEGKKLDSRYKLERYVILENRSDNSFKLVNSTNGSIVVRNAKHLRHVPCQSEHNEMEKEEVKGESKQEEQDGEEKKTTILVQPETIETAPIRRSERVCRRPGWFKDMIDY